MARQRLIKYSFFENELLGVDDADPLCSLMFIGLWCLADREGRLVDRPLKIWGKLFPLRSIADPNGKLEWLKDNGFIDRYEVDGQRYIQILNFTLHQNPHPNEKPSEIPKKLSKIKNSRVSREKQQSAHALTSYSSCTSFPSLENGVPPVAAAAAVIANSSPEPDIWTAGIELLKTAKMTEAQARPFLGRLAKQYTADLVHTAIEVTAAERPADPKAFLIGVLRERSGDNQRRRSSVGKHVPGAIAEPNVGCKECLDTGTTLQPVPEDRRQWEWEVEEMPCPACKAGSAAGIRGKTI